jgi:hypothetical protein
MVGIREHHDLNDEMKVPYKAGSPASTKSGVILVTQLYEYK